MAEVRYARTWLAAGRRCQCGFFAPSVSVPKAISNWLRRFPAPETAVPHPGYPGGGKSALTSFIWGPARLGWSCEFTAARGRKCPEAGRGFFSRQMNGYRAYYRGLCQEHAEASTRRLNLCASRSEAITSEGIFHVSFFVPTMGKVEFSAAAESAPFWFRPG